MGCAVAIAAFGAGTAISEGNIALALWRLLAVVCIIFGASKMGQKWIGKSFDKIRISLLKFIAPRFKGGRTIGILVPKDGRFWHIKMFKSGKIGPGANARGGPGTGYNSITRTHVEGHAAQYMRANGIKDAYLIVNHPKGVCGYCDKCLPHMLPSGSNMDVVTPSNPSNPIQYKGTGPK